jgi:predicted dehydrogenase
MGQRRREFLRLTAASPLLAPLLHPVGRSLAQESQTANERPTYALIGCGGQGRGDASWASQFADCVAVCDVDKNNANNARESGAIGKGKAEVYEDYRKVLDRNDVDTVIVGTPDHWHTKITIEAMKAGKDVYCEKPLTLTIDEGKLLCKAAEQTGKILQVGTQQRSSHNNVFLLAAAMVRNGYIGKIKKVTAGINGAPSGGPFAKETPPPELNWDMWLGQAPKVDYIKQRCHYEFRWWYEYSGGKLTDWGAHHVDVSHWALGMDDTGPETIEVAKGDLPVPYEHGWPKVDDCYNTATSFEVKATFAGGIPLTITSEGENGVMFTGEHGHIFVTRDRLDLDGGAVSALWQKPVAEEKLVELRYGKPVEGHMDNFFRTVKERGKPASDVWTHHRSMTTCHLANIAIRLGGRTLKWDPVAQQIVGDDEANRFLSREPRKGFEITV